MAPTPHLSGFPSASGSSALAELFLCSSLLLSLTPHSLLSFPLSIPAHPGLCSSMWPDAGSTEEEKGVDREPGRSYNWGQTVCQGLGEGSQTGQGRDEGGRGELGSGDGGGAEASSPGGPLPMERHPTFNPVMGAATGMAELRSPVCPGTCLSAV